MTDTALDKVLRVYRDEFGIRNDGDNAIHRDACIEVAALRAERDRLREALEAFLIAHANDDTNSDANELLDRMEAIGAGEQWESGEDLHAWAAAKAAAALAHPDLACTCRKTHGGLIAYWSSECPNPKHRQAALASQPEAGGEEAG